MINIENFSFTYAGSSEPAIKNISMEIKEGDFIGIIGGSGAGKTTLAHSICSVIPHYKAGDFYGSVTVDGMDTVDTEPEKIGKITGYVMQDTDSQMTASVVEDEILFGLENFSISEDEIEKRIEDALCETGITDLRHRNIDTLSGGQKQKAAIAAIIAMRPKILILDEPTGELDPKSSIRIFEMLKELNKKHGITIIVIEQKIMLMCEYVKKLAVINDGSLIKFGSVREVLRDVCELKRIGVSCPRVTDISESLRKSGIYSGNAAVTVNEAKNIIDGICRI